MTGKRRRRRAKRLFMRGNNLMAKQHKKSKWCSRSAYLCKNPKHYRWSELDGLPIEGVRMVDYNHAPYARVITVNVHDYGTEEALQKVVEGAFLSGDRMCYKALCILAFNNPEYSSWQDACLANYERIVNSPIPNRKLKRQV